MYQKILQLIENADEKTLRVIYNFIYRLLSN